MTAHDVVAAVRRRLGIRRVGHAGTLDPMATGVLPIAVGSHTRLLQYLEGGKTYEAVVAFGSSTTTADATGETVRVQSVRFGREELMAVLPRFLGTIPQRPPAFSAIHVQGKRAYELARAGIEVEMPIRQVEIRRIELLEFRERDDDPSALGPRALLEVDCAAGTYIRSLAVDLGAALGAPAHLAALSRTRAGAFRLQDSWPLDSPEPWLFAPMDTALAHLPVRDIEPQEALALRQGRPVPAGQLEGLVRAMAGVELVAIAQVRESLLWPCTVLPGDSM